MKLFVLSGDEGDDSVESYSRGETSVVYSRKEDLRTAKSLPEYDRSGIYLFASDSNQVYVGETSNFRRRLDQHSNDNKEKWEMTEAVIFFSRVRPLDKTELEYIEAVLIKSLKVLGYDSFNKNIGKVSDPAKYNIHPAQKYEAEKFIDDIKYLSSRLVRPEGHFFIPADQKSNIVGSSPLTESVKRSTGEVPKEREASPLEDKAPVKKIDRKKRKIIITDNEGRSVSKSSAKQTFLSYVQELSESEHYLKKMEEMAAGSGSRVFSLTDKTPVNNHWVSVSEYLYVYGLFSMGTLEKFIALLSEGTGLKIKMDHVGDA